MRRKDTQGNEIDSVVSFVLCIKLGKLRKQNVSKSRMLQWKKTEGKRKLYCAQVDRRQFASFQIKYYCILVALK